MSYAEGDLSAAGGPRLSPQPRGSGADQISSAPAKISKERETYKEHFCPSESESADHGTFSEKENESPLIAILKELKNGNKLVREGNQLVNGQTVLHFVNANSLSNVCREIGSLNETSREILATQGGILEVIKAHQNLINATWKDACDDLLVKTKAMRTYVDSCTSVQEMEMTRKLASMVENGEVIVTSYKLTDNGKPDGDIDGMVVGIMDGMEVVIFIEAKSHIKSSSDARRAMKQLRDIEGYWKDLINGYPALFSSTHGSKEQYDDYVALGVGKYGGRPIRFAFGAFLYGDSAINYFTYQNPKPLCITGNWNMKHEPRPLPVAI